ncbi:MAG TPA: protein kinase [Pyrinomonadaceae bacterium]|jgi:serine/threonine-protein kinase|nr:protein kinase [Pyrinomonadaceae bacterium]
MLRCPTCGRHYPSDVQFCSVDQTALQADPTIAGDNSFDPLIGHTLDEKYQLEQRLGIGGMGTVYRARHLLIDRAVAVKVLNQRLFEDEAARLRFHREAKAAGRLQHLNAVAVTDFGQTAEGYVYIVMELLEGRTLREILAKEAPLETARAVSMMLQASAAVAAAHEAGVIHRDLKPANILVTQSADLPSVVKVLDFGIAKVAAETLDDDEPNTLTQMGAMVGTPRYMSPEQCSGLELTPASDVYSLGVILYEMLTGMAPFSGQTPLAIAVKHASEYPRPPKEIVASIPDELENVVLHALEKDPQDRPANASEFRHELLDLTDKLGLEHHALISSPDIAALRIAGVESPSGRLVVDLSRLREGRVLTSGTSEVTVVRPPGEFSEEGIGAGANFSRMEIGLDRRRTSRNLLLAGVVLAALLLSGVAFFVRRSLVSSVPVAANANAELSPSPTPSPSPSPSPTATPEPKASPTPTPSPEKKRGKMGSFVNKVKRILKKPF